MPLRGVNFARRSGVNIESRLTTVTVSVSERARPSLVQGAPVTLGRGIHHCLGAPLARLEGRIVFETLLERFPEIGLLDERPRFRNGVVLRELQSLPLRCVRA